MYDFKNIIHDITSNTTIINLLFKLNDSFNLEIFSKSIDKVSAQIGILIKLININSKSRDTGPLKLSKCGLMIGQANREILHLFPPTF